MTGSSPQFTGVPFGRYVIRRRLARGGMGEVFLADQLGPLGPLRAVALKRMLPRVARDPRAAKMFLEEMATAAQLNHPNVATTYDFGEVDGVYFLAMEYVEGLSLRQVVETLGPLPIGEALSITAEVAAALEHAHTRRAPGGGVDPVVHRDVSPHNVMLSSAGAVKLLDFGIARAEAAVLGGRVEGKLAYAAPEQLAGAPADRRSDLWALGVVLYEILSGVVPFAAADPVAMLEATRAGRRVPLGARRPEATPVQAIVDRALVEQPELRWPTAEAFGAACRALAAELGAGSADGRASLVARAGGPRVVDASIGSRTGTSAAVDMATGVGVGLSEAARAALHLAAISDSGATELVPRPAILGARTAATERARTRVFAPDTPDTARDALADVSASGIEEPTPITAEPAHVGEATLPIADAAPRRPNVRTVAVTLVGALAIIVGGSAYVALRGDAPPVEVQAGPAGPHFTAAIEPTAATPSAIDAPRVGEARDRPAIATPLDAGPEPPASGVATAEPRVADAPPGDAAPPSGAAALADAAPVRASAPASATAQPRPRATARATPRASPRDRRPRETAPAESPAGLGLLSVRTVPWSRVSLDGRELGHSPLLNAPVPSGAHGLVLSPGQGDAAPRTITVHIRAGEVTKVFVDFERDSTRVEP